MRRLRWFYDWPTGYWYTTPIVLLDGIQWMCSVTQSGRHEYAWQVGRFNNPVGDDWYVQKSAGTERTLAKAKKAARNACLEAVGLRLTQAQSNAFVKAFAEAPVLGEVRYVKC